MGFSASTPVTDSTITNAPFWPEITTQDFAAASRLDGNVTTERSKNALIKGIIAVNKEKNVRDFKARQIALGITELASVPADLIDDESELVFLYRNAVYGEARAILTEHYRDFDTTTDADKRAKTLDPQIAAYRRETRIAIADLTGEPHMTCELI